MNIPQVKVDFNTQGMCILSADPISEQLEAYVIGIAQSFFGMKASSDTKMMIERAIATSLMALINSGQLFKNRNGIWDATGFLWVDNG